MPIIVACPTCSGQLRVTDDLLGRKVRCPACNAVFEAAAPPPTPEPPVETAPAWKNLNLELATESPPSSPPSDLPPEKTPNPAPKGAVEIDLALGDPGPRKSDAPAPEPAKRSDREERRPRLSDEEDLCPCPTCGKLIYRDALRCTSCGERFEDRSRRSRRFTDEDEDEDYPPRRRARRDCEPHRGGLVLTFGIIGVATFFMCPYISPLALGFAIAAWWMGGRDLRKIKAGTMDPDGQGTTQAGWICGIVGTCINLVALLGCGAFAGFMAWQADQESKRIKTRPFTPPPPAMRKNF